MTMEYINKGIIEKATAITPEEVWTLKGVLTYLFKVTFGGEHFGIMLMIALVVIVCSVRNYYGAKNTGQPLAVHEDSFFIAWSSIAAVFHASDLFWAWTAGKIRLLAGNNSPFANLWFAIFWGASAGLMILAISIVIRRIKAEQIERKAFYKHLHHIK